MCSIEGFTGPQPFTIEDYTKFNKDRGPDATNHWDDGIVHLGHNLLAIAPQPTNKSQPFETDKGNVMCILYHFQCYKIINTLVDIGIPLPLPFFTNIKLINRMKVSLKKWKI